MGVQSTMRQANGQSGTTELMVILCAEDDPDDRLLLRDAFNESNADHTLLFVDDGELLVAYLKRQGEYREPTSSPRPKVILLDLNMPRMSGREALRAIKADSQLSAIPVIVFTTSTAEADVVDSYEIGANSYITKPVTYEGLVRLMGEVGRYWLEIVRLPAGLGT